MSLTYLDVLAAAGAGGSDQALAEQVLTEATIHVDEFLGSNLLDELKPVPAEVADAAVLRCATDLFARAKAPFGTQILPDGSASGGMVVQRLGADPLGGIYSLVRPWAARVGLG